MARLKKLTVQQYQIAFARLSGLDIDQQSKQILAGMLEQSVADDELASAVRRLSPNRQANIRTTQSSLKAFQNSIVQRGKAGLLAMSDAEWSRLVEESNDT